MRKKLVITIASILAGLTCFAQADTLKKREVGLVFSNLNSFGLCYKSGKGNTLFRITALSLTGTNNNGDYSNFSTNGTANSIPANTTNSFGAGLNIGFETRKQINPNFYFYYGAALISAYSQSQATAINPTTYNIDYYNSSNVWTIQSSTVSNSSVSKTWSFSSGIGIIVGVAYRLGQSFSMGAEIIPSVTYSYVSNSLNSDTYGVNWKGNSSSGYTAAPYDNNLITEKMTKGISFSVINTSAAITLAYRIK
jgi:hypothetical protein